MDKTTLIAAILTTNGSGWSEADKPALEGMSEAVLTKIHANLVTKTPVANSGTGSCGCTGGATTPAAPAPTTAVQVPAPAPVANAAAPAPAATPAPAPIANSASSDDWWKAIPADKQVLINDALVMMNGIRENHIRTILSAPGNTLTANTLSKFETNELANMSTLVTNGIKAQEQAAAAAAEAAEARQAAAAAAQNQTPFIDYRAAAPAPITNAAGTAGKEPPKHSPLKMLSTFSGN